MNNVNESVTITEIGNDLDRRVADSLKGLPRAARFIVLRARFPRRKISWCVEKAGYSQGTHADAIEGTAAARLAMQSLEQQRVLWQQDADASLSAVVARQVAIASSPKAENRDRLRADLQTSEVLGYKAPQRLDIRGAFLVRELSGLSGAELAALAMSQAI